MDHRHSEDDQSDMDYLRSEGFENKPVDIFDPRDECEPRGTTPPVPEGKRRCRGFTPSCGILFGAAFRPPRRCSEDPESASSETDDAISCSSPASSECTSPMSDSSSPAETGPHSSAPSPATTYVGSSPESTVATSIERDESPEASVEPRPSSSPVEPEPDRQETSQKASDHDEVALVLTDDGGRRESSTPRRSSTPANHWRCHQPGCTTKPFKSRFQLDSHQVRHTDTRNHNCTYEGCKRGFRRKSELVRHMRSVHRASLPAVKGLVCPHCKTGHSFARLDTLQRHTRRIHLDLTPT